MNSDHLQLIAENIGDAIHHEVIDSVMIDDTVLYLVKVQVEREHINELNWMVETIHLADGTEIVSMVNDNMSVGSCNLCNQDTYKAFKHWFNDFNVDKMALPHIYQFLATNEDAHSIIKFAYDLNKDKSVTAIMYNIAMVCKNTFGWKFVW